MLQQWIIVCILCAGLLSPMLLAGCGPKPRTTRLQIDDLNAATEAMAQSLAASRFLAERGPDSPPIYVTINKVQNLTDDIIPPAEQWMFVERVRSSLPIQQLRETKNVRFQITPEQARRLADMGFDVSTGQMPATTHVMTAVFMSSPRMVRDADGNITRRQDFYYLECSITDLNTRQVVWTGGFEFKREAVGLLID